MADPIDSVISALVEAARSVTLAEREPFTLVSSSIDSHWIILHKGLPGGSFRVYPGDFAELEHRRMFRFQNHGGGHRHFDLTSTAVEAYDSAIASIEEPIERAAEPMRRRLESHDFVGRHPRAQARWRMAEELLWRADTADQYTAIGHHCREAMQEFGISLLALHPTPGASIEVPATKNRIEAVVRAHGRLGERGEAFLLALIALWKAVVDLAQRQEHALAAPGTTELTWNDSRRLVQHTASVMFEVDSAVR